MEPKVSLSGQTTIKHSDNLMERIRCIEDEYVYDFSEKEQRQHH